MKKFKLFAEYDKEEKWLEEKAQNGWLLRSKGLFYTFVKCHPTDIYVGADYRTFKNKAAYQDYRFLFEDMGWIYLAGHRYSGEQYFMRLANGKEKNRYFLIEALPQSGTAKKRRITWWWRQLYWQCCWLCSFWGSLILQCLLTQSRLF
ncbi:MAG: DUF2812 domain-containing protein [Oscillospiraceae bacterium]